MEGSGGRAETNRVNVRIEAGAFLKLSKDKSIDLP